MITARFVGKLIVSLEEQCALPVQVALGYDAEGDPLAVKMAFSTPHEGHIADWTFGRELLAEATRTKAAVGTGDVQLRQHPREAILGIGLTSPEGHAFLHFPLQAVADFLVEADAETEPVETEAAIGAALDEFLAEVFE